MGFTLQLMRCEIRTLRPGHHTSLFRIGSCFAMLVRTMCTYLIHTLGIYSIHTTYKRQDGASYYTPVKPRQQIKRLSQDHVRRM